MSPPTETCRVAVLDMQPIEPAVGGGRLRLLGLYHALGKASPTRYVGTYDWPGPTARTHKLSRTLEEIDVPLSPEHFEAHARWKARFPRQPLIDITFDLLGNLSPDYVEKAAQVVADSDVVVFSHPWVYPLLRGHLQPKQLLVYDSHNVEGLLRTALLDDGSAGTELAKHVVLTEGELARKADLVLVCSPEDGRLFKKLYRVPAERIADAPNGVFTERIRPAQPQQRLAARRKLKLRGSVAIFIGSEYAPNVEAVRFIHNRVAPALPDTTFLICGGVGLEPEIAAMQGRSRNLRILGKLTETQKQECLWAADVGLNPMFSGSGTNIKMFDFMAAGLPVVTTPVGARGIDAGEEHGIWAVEGDALAPVLARLVAHPSLCAKFGARARERVCEKYAWERISPQVGTLLRRAWQAKRSTGSSPAAPAAPAKPRLQPVRPPASEAAERKGLTPVGLISTWRTRCGIAEYAQYLSKAMLELGVEPFVFVGGARKPAFVRGLEEDAPSVTTNEVRQLEKVDPTRIAQAARASGIGHLLIQHHPGFFSEEVLRAIVVECRLEKLRVTVTCHNTRLMSPDGLARIAAAGAELVVHSKDEASRLKRLAGPRIAYVPHGIMEIPDVDRIAARRMLGWSGGPVIGTFGFLRDHKGLAELLEAFTLVRDVHPEAKLLALTALYPSEDSRRYLSRCTELMAEHGLDQDGRVRLDIAFHEIEEVIHRLHACDLIVLPYHPNVEGASGSANIAFATKRPVVLSRSDVFRDARAMSYTVESVDPLCIASGICNLLAHPELAERQLERMERHVAERGWSKVAVRYRDLLLAEEAEAGSEDDRLAG